MNRRRFIQSSTTAGLAAGLPIRPESAPAEGTVYVYNTYHLQSGGKMAGMGKYLENALIPAMKRMGAGPTGAWTELGKSDPPKLHVLQTFMSMTQFASASSALAADSEYTAASEEFSMISHDNPPYERNESMLLDAFSGHPMVEVPDGSTDRDRLFELRIYESATEAQGMRKMAMFDELEIDLFRRVALHPVFFGRNIAGPHMPCLTYMLRFDDMNARDAAWSEFVGHPEWNEMKVLPRFTNTVSRIQRVFLKPTAYSQI